MDKPRHECPGETDALCVRLDEIQAALARVRIPAVLTEPQLHALIADALAASGIEAAHEARLCPGRRIDFLCGRVGIEVKVGEQPRGRLLRQAEKYLALDQLDALILAVTRGVSLPGAASGKPMIVFGLNRLWGVSLP